MLMVNIILEIKLKYMYLIHQVLLGDGVWTSGRIYNKNLFFLKNIWIDYIKT